MSEREGELLLQRQRRWRLGKWTSFAVLAISVIVALSSTVSKLQRTVEMIDEGTAGTSAYREMSERATFRTLLGFGLGSAAMLAYMVCFVMHQRATRRLRDWEDHERRARRAELGAEEPDLPL